MPDDMPPPNGDSEYWLACEPGRVPGPLPAPPPGVLNPLPGPPPYGAPDAGRNPAPGPDGGYSTGESRRSAALFRFTRVSLGSASSGDGIWGSGAAHCSRPHSAFGKQWTQHTPRNKHSPAHIRLQLKTLADVDVRTTSRS